MNPFVYVAGLGVISAIGNNLSECLLSLQSGKSGIYPISKWKQTHFDNLPVGEVKLSDDELAERAGLPANSSRSILLSMIAAKEALENVNIPKLDSLRTGFISANSTGGMDRTEIFYQQFYLNERHGRLRNIVNHECGSITDIVAEKLGIRHYTTTISTACSSSANSIMCAARMIRQNLLDVAVAGGVDALTQFTLNGFNSLMITDHEACKPFSANRNGLNLGEGAGYIVLVSERVAGQLASLYCRLNGCHNANDAFHQTASSPEGIGSYMAMQGALKKSDLHASDIGYINLHGTATLNNDLSEGTAICKLFAPTVPKLSSTKSFTGHTLGASGGIEAVFSVMSVHSGFIYPNLRFEKQMTEFSFAPETHFSIDKSVKHVLSNSFGFGGNCTSLIFSAL